MNYNLVIDELDVEAAYNELQENRHLFNQITYRKDAANSPHKEMDDIWVRYNDIRPYEASGSLDGINDEHKPVWYPSAQLLPSIVDLCFDVMAIVKGEELGGVLITKLPPHSKIEPHIDEGWHAGYYDKYYVSIRSPKNSKFCFDDGEIEANNGDVYWFRNDVPHWVINDSNEERITLVISIRTDETRRRLIEEGVKTTHYFSDGICAKEMTMPKGTYATKHTHDYTHLSILAKGEVIVSVDGVASYYKAPTCITVEAGKEHTIEAIKDSVWFCIHATDEVDESKIDNVLIKGV